MKKVTVNYVLTRRLTFRRPMSVCSLHTGHSTKFVTIGLLTPAISPPNSLVFSFLK